MSRLTVFFVALFACFYTSLAHPASVHRTIRKLKRDTRDGKATAYDAGLGACGYTDSDNDAVVAVSHLIYGNGDNCDQWLQVTNKANGQSQYGKMRDRCQGCDESDLDLSTSLFQSLGADLSEGVIQVEWYFMDKNFSP